MDRKTEYQRLIETQFLSVSAITDIAPWHLAKLVGYANTCDIYASTEDDDLRGIRLRPYPPGTLVVTSVNFDLDDAVTLYISVCDPLNTDGYPRRVKAVWQEIAGLQIHTCKLFKEIWDETQAAPDDPPTWRDRMHEPL